MCSSAARAVRTSHPATTGRDVVVPLAASKADERAARIGGDEFGLILPDRRGGEAEALGAQIDREVRALHLDLSISWGVAEWPAAGPSRQ